MIIFLLSGLLGNGLDDVGNPTEIESGGGCSIALDGIYCFNERKYSLM